MWKESLELCIGKADVNENGMKCTYVVGRYRPAGNMIGDYAKNVPKGSFNKAQACAGIKRAKILPGSKVDSHEQDYKKNTSLITRYIFLDI